MDFLTSKQSSNQVMISDFSHEATNMKLISLTDYLISQMVRYHIQTYKSYYCEYKSQQPGNPFQITNPNTREIELLVSSMKSFDFLICSCFGQSGFRIILAEIFVSIRVKLQRESIYTHMYTKQYLSFMFLIQVKRYVLD